MNTHFLRNCWMAAMILLVVAANTSRAQHTMSGNIVADWNMTCMSLTPSIGTHMGIRTLAMMHVAIYDTVVAFAGTHKPFYVSNAPPAGASQVAAASAAAYRVLYLVFTNATQRQTIQMQYDAQLAMIPNGPAKSSGISFGQSVANAVIARRSTDGALAALGVPYPDGTLPGQWRRTASGEPIAPGWGSVTPWAMSSGSQFDRGGPPALASQEYADAYNAVKVLGAANSQVRTPEQSAIATFWDAHVPAKWNSLARDLAAREHLSLVESARLFSLLSVTLADAAIAGWSMKYSYGFWRPETAIRLGNHDTNDCTLGDPTWQPYLVSPAFPEYVSGHSLTSAAAAKLLELFFGTGNYTFELGMMGMPDTRTYHSFWEAAAEAGISRFWGGLHFPFSNTDGLQAGAALAQNVYTNAMLQVAPVSAMMGSLVDGATGTTFALTAGDGHVSTADGNSVYFWGYGLGANAAQYVGPTLIVREGELVTVALHNRLPVPVSILFPGHDVTAVGGTAGILTREVPPGSSSTPSGPVTYSFMASKPGTYLYHSGTRMDLQVEMGLVGALIVRPAGFDAMNPATWKAYDHPDTGFDHEFLFLLTEMDETVHDLVEQQRMGEVDTTKHWPVYWFINGRTGPDTMSPSGASWLPTQPYNCMPMFHPGEKVLMRMIGGGRDPHPFHHHGNHSRIIAKDGRMLESASGAGTDLSQMVFTIPVVPGATTDALFSWTGEKLGWDIYGHKPGDPLEPFEYAPDHGKPIPAVLPTEHDLTFGQMYGGSPFLGSPNPLPPGQGGFNPNNGFSYMWHSHAEKEICNNNIFPGGMMTMILIEAHPQAP